MKQYILFFCCLLFLFYPASVSAHLLGQQSFFKVNNSYTALYPVPSTSLSDFILPQDSAPKSYIIGEPIAFEIDTTKLPMMSDDMLTKTRFQWNFGDGETFEGIKTTHAYNKMGSYILQIWADDRSGSAPILLQSILLHIIPDASFVLPKAVISVNGKMSKDPLTDPLSFSFTSPLMFDATKSKIPAGMTSIQWDFGDMHSSSQKSLQYQYKDDLRIVFPVLRIKDKNGFIADTFVQINNSAYDNPSADENSSSNKIKNFINAHGIFLAIGICILLIITAFLFFKKKK